METLRFPALFSAAEVVSARSQRRFLRVRAFEFSALILVAAFSLLPNDEISGFGSVVAVAFLALALALRLSGFAERAERQWYDARAAAESIKSSSWQFAVCGEAFRRSDSGAEARFLQELREVLALLPNLDIPSGEKLGLAVTSEMAQLRAAGRPERTETYMRERVEDQLGWYSGKANWNRRRAAVWRWLLISIEVAGVTLGVLRASGEFDVDWLAFVAACSAGVAAWQQLKNYASLSEAYAVTSQELQFVTTSLAAKPNEDTWAQAVHDAEAAFSREHTLWLARRQGPKALL